MLKSEDLNYKTIINNLKKIANENYGDSNIDDIELVLRDIIDFFSGKKKGIQKCDTKYHDIKHTLQVIPPFAGIIDGWNKSGKIPRISK